jgi:hypothetical protein
MNFLFCFCLVPCALGLEPILGMAEISSEPGFFCFSLKSERFYEVWSGELRKGYCSHAKLKT